MNLVYGVSGEGLGHVFEALEILPLLLQDGHRVRVLTYGDRACQALAAYQPRRIEGLPLYFDDRGLSLPTTLMKNRHVLPYYLRHGGELIREVADFGPDAFLTAYEPFTTFLAHRLRRPLISMDNQNELLYIPRPPGTRAFDFHLARLATRVCTYGADHYIVKCFQRLPVRRSDVSVVAPIIQRQIRALEPVAGDHVLVYLTKANPGLLEILRSIPESFVVYCLGRVGTEGNLQFRAPGPAYLEDLRACKAVIATTGFSLIADSIYLKKPYFGVPLRKQFEQTYNAQFLRRSGLGDYSETPSRAELLRFLAGLPAYREQLARRDFDPGEQEEALRAQLERLSTPRRRAVTAACL